MQPWETWVRIGLYAQPQAQYIRIRTVTIQSRSAGKPLASQPGFA